MAVNPRLEELKRRVQQDPASIAFAALAEEFRRDGQFWDAIETCRAGLTRHPAYVSARVTLGRALIEVGELDEGREHLEQVLRVAPENLAAIRALAEIHRRRGEAGLTDESDAIADTSSAVDAPTLAAAPGVADPLPATSASGPSLGEPLTARTPAAAGVARDVILEENGTLARLDQFLGAIARAKDALVTGALRPDSLTR